MAQMFPNTEGEIPWHCLTDHIDSACPSACSFDLSDLQLKSSSDPEQRRAAYIHFASAFASHVAAEAAILRATIPKPGASAEEWAASGVSDDALFSTLGVVMPAVYTTNASAGTSVKRRKLMPRE
ncbi:hypothetical protein BDZ89DRAFT_362550 [Hymenopellis radicata]|nr:hypothetical protein BDZ89DRAFT_362550 [Hymenopellis radicata]